MSQIYIIAPLILFAVVIAAVWLERFSVPVILVALGGGIVFGNDVLQLVAFQDMHLAKELASAALIFVLFYGGLLTDRKDFRAVALPAAGLATWGVILTAGVTFLCLYYGLHWPAERSILLAVIVSSTDAAAIFSILRSQSLPREIAATVEIESAANDPMAILLTVAVVSTLASGADFGWMGVLLLGYKFVVGPLIGYAIGCAAVWMLNRLTPHDRGYYYMLLIGVILLAYGVAELAQTSGMLAVFVAGYAMGNRTFVHKQGILNFADSISSISNIGLFILLGLLVFPSDWPAIWWNGTLLFLVLTFVARPVAVFLGTLGMGSGLRERVFVSWAGLRGAVPIVLATYPVAAGISGGHDIFNLVFFAVLLSIIVQGGSLGRVARWLGLSTPARPRPLFKLDLITMAHTDYELIAVELPGPEHVKGPKLRDLRLPEGSVITLITRNTEVVLPQGNTRLRGYDRVTVLAHSPDRAAVEDALFRPFGDHLLEDHSTRHTLPEGT